MTATTLTPTATAPAVWPGAQPMASEQAEAFITKIEHLLADLEAATDSLAATSWGPQQAPETARYLPDGTRQEMTAWAQRITNRLAEVAELKDVLG